MSGRAIAAGAICYALVAPSLVVWVYHNLGQDYGFALGISAGAIAALALMLLALSRGQT